MPFEKGSQAWRLRSKSGKPKSKKRLLKEAINQLESEGDLIDTLLTLAYGIPVICPKCSHEIKRAGPDKDCLMYLVDRKEG